MVFYSFLAVKELNFIVNDCGFKVLEETIAKDSLFNRDVCWLNAVLRKI
jgi:hypothetical protein